MDTSFLAALLAAGVGLAMLATLIGSAVARAGFPVPDEARRMGCVDGLRGYLAIAVAVYHFGLWSLSSLYGLPWQRPDSDILDSLGPGSVNLFFMITGFVFYPRILAGARLTNWPAVYMSRAFRLLPAVIASVALIAITILVRLDFRPLAPLRDTLIAIPLWLFGFERLPLFGYPNSSRLNAGVLWSIGYEWMFYALVLPAAALGMDLIKKVGLPTAIVPTILIGTVLTRFLPASPFGLSNYLPMFGIGMAAYEIASRPFAQGLKTSAVSWILVALLISGMITHGPVRLLCHALFFIGIAAGNSLFGLLKNSGALVLGEASFSIYLIHGFIMENFFTNIVRQITIARSPILVTFLPIVGLIAVLISFVSFRFLELPMIQYGKRLSHWLFPRRAGQAQPAKVAR